MPSWASRAGSVGIGIGFTFPAMKLLLLYVLLVLALVFVLLVQPSARNRALLKCVALVSVVALLFPLQLAYAIALPAVVLALWLVWRAVFWPLYWLEDVLRR